MTDYDAVDAAFTEVEERQGPVEVLVANAGVTSDTLIMRMTEEQFQKVIDANLTGAFRVAKRASRNMIKQRFGRLHLHGIGGPALTGLPGQANYAASKAGLVGMARSSDPRAGFAPRHRQRGRPGFIDTEMTQAMDPKHQEMAQQAIPLAASANPRRSPVRSASWRPRTPRTSRAR